MKLNVRFSASAAISPQMIFFRNVKLCRINILVILKETVAPTFRVTELDLCGYSDGAVMKNSLILMKGNI
jgi:hypothetical protein